MQTVFKRGPSATGVRRAAMLAAVAAVLAALSPMLVSAVFARGPESVAEVADGLQDTVVNISTTQTLKGGAAEEGAPGGPGPKNSPFEEFFTTSSTRKAAVRAR